MQVHNLTYGISFSKKNRILRRKLRLAILDTALVW